MKIAVITPIQHIENLVDELSKCGDVTFMQIVDKRHVHHELVTEKFDVIFTNPNEQRFMIDADLLHGTNVSIIVTASTGTNHIDVSFCRRNHIKIIALTHELSVLEEITATAEHAFCLMLCALRHVIPANSSVKTSRQWTWQPFLGRQVRDLTVGVVGCGRLGKMMCKYCVSFGASVIVYDPHVDVASLGINARHASSLEELMRECDVVSLHVHVTPQTVSMINADILECARNDAVIVNTSRSAIVDEDAIVDALRSHKLGHYAADVIDSEFTGVLARSKLLCLSDDLVTLTPHIGGATVGSQHTAYHHVVKMLQQHLLVELET